MRSAIALLAALALGLWSTPVTAKKRPPCPDAAYVVEDAPLIPGDESLAHNGVVDRAGTLSIGGSCQAVKVKRKGTKKGTRLTARFKSCAGIEGPVRFSGLVDPTCTTLTGKLKGKRAKLAKDVAGTAVPTGAVRGIAQIVRTIAVPLDARSEVLAQKAQIEGLEPGAVVNADGSAITHTPVGAGGWRVTVGTQETRVAADGSFTLTLDEVGPTEGVLYHPAQDTEPAIVFWLVPHLTPVGGPAPATIDIELETQGACGMDENPDDNPAYCAALAAAGIGQTAHAGHHGHAAMRPASEPPVTAPVTFVWTVGPRGSYPSLTPTSCRDQDGGFGLAGTTTLGALTNYVGSTCDTQVTLGCCDNELGSIKVSIKSALGKITGFKPVACQQNHKGRFCDDLLHDDVGVQVPAGIVNASGVLALAKTVTQPVAPAVPVPVTVHHNACYGETIVTKTLNDLGGTLNGLTGNKVLHYTTNGAGRHTFVADVGIQYVPPASCPPNVVTPSDTYHFEADGYGVDVTFTMTCTVTTTTTGTAGSTSTTLQVGRAVRLLFPTGPAAAQTDLCLDRVGGGLVVAAHAPFCEYVHLHAQGTTISIDGTGTYIDPHVGPEMEPCGFGEIVTVPGCGPDSVPNG